MRVLVALQRRWLAIGGLLYLCSRAVARQRTVASESKRAFADLERQLEQRTQELQALAADLARSQTEMERFAYIVSHDLKGPLRSITGFSSLLERKLGPALDEGSRQYLQFIVDGARHLQALIDDLLEYSRAGAKPEQPQPIALEQLLAKVLTQLAKVIAETRADVVAEPLPLVRGDPQRLLQLFRNLLDNALKFRGEAPPRVRIWAEDAGTHWRLAVADNGIGIELRQQQRIFDVFQRLHGPEAYPGTGIGLAICKRIVESHGGRIWVESAPGEGATFWFTLPKDREEAVAA